jgi:hypothetical protein
MGSAVYRKMAKGASPIIYMGTRIVFGGPPRVYAVAMEAAALTEDQLRAELRTAGKQALVGFVLGLAAGSAVSMTLAALEEFQGV